MQNGNRFIVVLDRGWIMVGNVTDNADGTHTISNCANLRKWESGGFGGVTTNPSKSGVLLDPCADVIYVNEIMRVPISDDWGA